jgi:hypothetical protein
MRPQSCFGGDQPGWAILQDLWDSRTSTKFILKLQEMNFYGTNPHPQQRG